MQEKPKKKRGLSLGYALLITFAVIAGFMLIWFLVDYIRESRITYATIGQLRDFIKATGKSTNDSFYISSWYQGTYDDILRVTVSGTPAEIGAVLNNPRFVDSTYSFSVVLSGTLNKELPNSVIQWAYPTADGTTHTYIEALTRLTTGSKTINETTIKLTGVIASQGFPKQNAWSKYIQPGISAFAAIGFVLILFYSFRWSLSARENGMFGATNSKSVAQRVYSNKKFSDIAGNEEVKEEVAELVDYLKYPKKYEAAGARIPKGILLGGPPGTGKTLIAKATAGEANVPFFFISASNFVEMFVGLGAKRVRDMFNEARQAAPAIIFIDELDAVGRSRGAGIGGGNDEREQTLNQLLVEMDGIKENSGILIMAATNRTDVLDPALLRPGRFDRTITVGLPDIKEREEILKLHARGKRIAPEVNFALIARRTPGFSGAQLENVINEASLLSVRENHSLITTDEIDEAIDRVMAGPAKKSRTISEKENIAVAYHEAGHAVVGLKVKGGNKVQKITIIPRGQAGGYNLMMPEEEKYNRSKAELLAMITSFMGGRVAEAIIYGADNVSTGASDDIAKATTIARRMVTEWGLSDLGPIKYEEDSQNPFLGRDYMKSVSFSNKVGQEIDEQIRKIILKAQKDAYEIISENRELLELIKDALIINETIVAEEIEYIEKNMKLPPALDKTKAALKKEYSSEDFDELFNEVAGNKKLDIDNYKDDLDKELKKHNIKEEEDKEEEN
ncbi:ATP-dependent zinc metalloprotease FtsH [Metamycoplasma neophronis]|uniref:ATP-dependent zinc metalloprotease FtsH n=1 Tax=Metamycoplasma neophronis TaxID=872983 RepID=A0ABY2Z4D8_9BACT|nr:ATP-dependent zinc metalloprotease FtsH [Metamycoplasma neophronis]TPR53867.1 ATP-dependent zinc metalloprotease FtsH [Metamycoplasma neophronis]